VVIHESSAARMDFKAKNFQYVTRDFGDFVAAASAGDHVYLRATSVRQPAERPACLENDFPSLASDFVLPPELSSVSDPSAFFSSVLRIQGVVSMWLHYDVDSPRSLSRAARQLTVSRSWPTCTVRSPARSA